MKDKCKSGKCRINKNSIIFKQKNNSFLRLTHPSHITKIKTNDLIRLKDENA
jgi:hypothetical protein